MAPMALGINRPSWTPLNYHSPGQHVPACYLGRQNITFMQPHLRMSSEQPCQGSSSCKRQATPCTKAFSSAANSAESSSSSSSTQSPSIAAVEVSPADTGSSRLEEPTGFRAWLPTPTSWLLLKQVFAMVKSNLWPILIIFAAKDGLSFLLHRSSQRLTNIVAEALLGIPLSEIANPWWLYLDPAFLESNLGYQGVIVIFFLLTLPINMLLSVYATAASAMIIAKPADTVPGSSTSTPSGSPSSDPLSPSSASHVTPSPPITTQSSPATPSSNSSTSTQSAGPFSRAGSSSSGGGSSGSGIRSNRWSPLWAANDNDGGIAALGELGITMDTRSTSLPYGASRHPPQPSWDDGDVAAGAVSIAATSPPTDQRLVELARARSEAEFAGGGGSSIGDSSDAGSSDGNNSDSSTSAADAAKQGWLTPLREGISVVMGVLPAVQALWKRAWITELVFNLQALPLQGASVLVFPTYWTVPRFLGIQLALPVSIMEGSSGTAAVDRSLHLMAAARNSFGWLLLSLLLSTRLVDSARTVVLQMVPPRYWSQVVEVPVLLIVAFACIKLLLARMQDLLPLATYLHLSRSQPESKGAEQPSAEDTSKVSLA